MIRTVMCGWCLAALFLSTGCQRQPTHQFAPVEGTVTKGGKPLAGVVVIYWPEAGVGGPNSIGPTDAAGRYRLHTEQGEEGAVVGRHRVCVLDTKALLGRMSRGNANRGDLPKDLTSGTASPVPPRYAGKDETPLRAEVRSGGQVIDLDVK